MSKQRLPFRGMVGGLMSECIRKGGRIILKAATPGFQGIGNQKTSAFFLSCLKVVQGGTAAVGV